MFSERSSNGLITGLAHDTNSDSFPSVWKKTPDTAHPVQPHGKAPKRDQLNETNMSIEFYSKGGYLFLPFPPNWQQMDGPI
jgi:hypothetical protein